MTTEMIPQFDLPTWVLEELKPHAQLMGCNSGKSSTIRWAAIQKADELRDLRLAAEKAAKANDLDVTA